MVITNNYISDWPHGHWPVNGRTDLQKTMAALRVSFYTERSIFTVFCGLRTAWKITIEKGEFTPHILLILLILKS